MFLPISLMLYYITPNKFKNCILLILSLLFYAWGEPKYIALMIVLTFLNYIFGLAISKALETDCLNSKHVQKSYSKNSKKSKIKNKKVKSKYGLKTLILGLFVNIFVLIIFKYSIFILTNFNIFSVNTQVNMETIESNIHLPIGISFYIFQSISYLIDVYRDKQLAQKNIVDFYLYVTMFPQLIAGPIVRYKTISSQIKERNHTLEKIAQGIYIFSIGLGKKVILSNQLAVISDNAFSGDDLSVLGAWLGIICYTLQIYFDFSGYSDMAIGLGKMFGFELPENFNYPYISKSITEFWRRWHISLTSWFKDYVYIPLGGNRCSTIKWMRNIFVVWLLTGIWHGASWNFIIWGIYYGLILIFEKFYLKEKLEKLPKVIQRLYMIILVMIGWVMFRADNISSAINYLGNMFGISSTCFIDVNFFIDFLEIKWIIFVSILLSTPIFRIIIEQIRKKIGKLEEIEAISKSLIASSILIVSTILLINLGYNPFLYFQF
jgi:alginate O-acetyltransferase complex protein AlgI